MTGFDYLIQIVRRKLFQNSLFITINYLKQLIYRILELNDLTNKFNVFRACF